MSCFDKGFELSFRGFAGPIGREMGVDHVQIQGPVPVIPVWHVLDNRRYPNRVKPHTLDVVKVVGYVLKGTTEVGEVYEILLTTRVTPCWIAR